MNPKFGELDLKSGHCHCFVFSRWKEKSVSTLCTELARDEGFVMKQYICVGIKLIQKSGKVKHMTMQGLEYAFTHCVYFHRVAYSIVINTFNLKYDLFRQKFVHFARFHYVMPLNYVIWEFRWKSTRSIYAVILNFISFFLVVLSSVLSFTLLYFHFVLSFLW